MKKLTITLAVGATVGVGILAWGLWPTTTRTITAPTEADLTSPDLIEQGAYVARAADCTACHTAEDDAPFAGGVAIETPIGAVYSSNITPDSNTGIHDYSLDEFDRAVRHGIRQDGTTLYPAMPFPAYARMTDDDIIALYAYFRNGVDPVFQTNKQADIPWPISMRWPLAFWRKAFGPSPDGDDVFDPSDYENEQLARGAYLVQGPGHCGTCHTPRAFTQKERGMDESNPNFLAGAPNIEGWTAVNLRGNEAEGLGRWSEEDIVRTLKTARNAHSAVLGEPMQEVVVKSMQHLSDDDVSSMAHYLKSLSPAPNEESTFVDDEGETANTLARGETTSRGGEIYLDSCNACHMSDGRGTTNAVPSIAGNPSVLRPQPDSLIRLVLAGGTLPLTHAAPSELGMPDFGWRFSDEEIAEVVSFIRSSWGNQATSVEAEDVAAIRDELNDGEEEREQR